MIDPNMGLDIANRLLGDIAHLQATIRIAENVMELLTSFVVFRVIVSTIWKIMK